MRRLGVALVLLLALLMSALGAGTSQAAVERQPDLRMLRPSGFYIQSTSWGARLLRFNTVITNDGPGAFDVRGSRPDTATKRMNLTQRVYRSDGTYRNIAIPLSGSYGFYSGDGHDHWHVYRLQEFTIRRVNADGSLGNVAGRGAKTGFCFYDNTKVNLGLSGAPQTPVYRGCGGEDSLTVTMGLSVGWGDTYGANLHLQWIKINGLPDGKYRVHVTADPSNRFLEGNETNNRSFTTIQIRGNTVAVLG